MLSMNIMCDMTQTKIDPTKANIEELRRWLAEQLCPVECSSRTECIHAGCEATGLAFPWASKKCRRAFHNSGHEIRGFNDCPHCHGSGRVPKAVGLEELVMLPGTSWSFEPRQDDYWCGLFHSVIDGEPLTHSAVGETPLLAALRAKVAQVKAEMG